MQVALDARSLQSRPHGGIARSLVNVLPLLQPDCVVHLLTDSRGVPLTDLPDFPVVPLRTPLPGISASWLQLRAPAWLRGFDGIFHCPFYGLPAWLPVPGVVTIHDLTFEHFPNWYSRKQTLAFRSQARRAARTAACILTVSEFVKQDIVTTYHVDPDRVLIAPHGVDPVFRPDLEARALRERLGLLGPYVIALSGAPRRQVDVAIGAWELARRQGVEIALVIVGGAAPLPCAGLVHVPAPEDAVWAALLSNAEAFLYPTLYEGFGMPALEAMGAGTPVVAAASSSLPEVIGDAGAWAESATDVALASTLIELLSDKAKHAELRARGLRRVAEAPGWAQAANVHLEAYHRASA